MAGGLSAKDFCASIVVAAMVGVSASHLRRERAFESGTAFRMQNVECRVKNEIGNKSEGRNPKTRPNRPLSVVGRGGGFQSKVHPPALRSDATRWRLKKIRSKERQFWIRARRALQVVEAERFEIK